jgi:hypothetical protein
MKHPVVQAKNGVTVYVNLIGSQAAESIAQYPYLLGLVKELLQQTKIVGPLSYFDHDMGRAVGSANVVETSDKDTILYAQALHGDLYKRFVKNGKPLSTQHISVILRRDDEGDYELVDTWVGPLRPPHPGTESETKASRSYWDTHAFVLDREPIKLRTLTKTCPY